MYQSSWLCWCLHDYTHLSKLIKCYTLNRYSLPLTKLYPLNMYSLSMSVIPWSFYLHLWINWRKMYGTWIRIILNAYKKHKLIISQWKNWIYSLIKTLSFINLVQQKYHGILIHLFIWNSKVIPKLL